MASRDSVEIGIKQVSRAATLYEFAFAKAEDCILVSQDWITDGTLAKPSMPCSGRLAPDFRAFVIHSEAPPWDRPVPLGAPEDSQP